MCHKSRLREWRARKEEAFQKKLQEGSFHA